MLSHSVVSDSETPWTVAHQTPLSMEILHGQEYWSGLSFPSPYEYRETAISKLHGKSKPKNSRYRHKREKSYPKPPLKIDIKSQKMRRKEERKEKAIQNIQNN